MSLQRDDKLIGAQLGQYTIIQEIGRGGMATVYSAKQTSMNRTVAIKVLPRHFLHDPGFLERFNREVEVISGLEHPHILPIYDYGETEGVPFIAMRYLGGGSMAQMVRRGVPSLDELRKPFQQIAEALDYAHRQGIIHRDLKPGNVMLDEHGNAYLSDFGVARVMGSDLTGSAIIGTPAYMSPEQAQGVAIDARSDIYALGIVLFELITGREPYQAETPMSVLLKHLNEPIPQLAHFRKDVPKALQSVVEKAIAKNPDERYKSATELSEAFNQALGTGQVEPSLAVQKAIASRDALAHRKAVEESSSSRKHRIFISYRKLDQEVVYQLAEMLQSQPEVETLWIDEELTPGKHWWKEILTEIRNATTIILAISDYYLDSEPCRREYKYALDLNKNVLPVKIGEVDYLRLPREISLIQMPEFDAKDRSLTDIRKALQGQPSPRPLPKKRPPEPEEPISEIYTLEIRAQQVGRFDDQDEAYLFHQLNRFLRRGDAAEQRTARSIITRILQQRKRDITVSFMEDLEDLLK